MTWYASPSFSKQMTMRHLATNSLLFIGSLKSNKRYSLARFSLVSSSTLAPGIATVVSTGASLTGMSTARRITIARCTGGRLPVLLGVLAQANAAAKKGAVSCAVATDPGASCTFCEPWPAARDTAAGPTNAGAGYAGRRPATWNAMGARGTGCAARRHAADGSRRKRPTKPREPGAHTA